MIYTPAKEVRVGSSPDVTGSVDLASFLHYLYRRRNVMIIACVVALTLAGTVSFFLPKKYTATSSILIEPPAGNDPRGATAVSPVYLESLKTYEHFATSDSLFQGALEHLQLRRMYARTPIEALKRQVLKVSKPKETKILEISATMTDPMKAQQFAQYIAEQTVAMNRSLESAAVRDLSGEAEVLVRAARTRLDNARRARESYIAHEPIASLEAELAGLTELKSRVDRDLLDSHLELAAYQARSDSKPPDKSQPTEGGSFRGEIAALKAEISTLERHSQELASKINAETARLEERKHERESLDKEAQTAQSQYEAAVSRNTDILSSASFRGERLEIIDPGVVPERPSSPNIPLNLVVALLASGIASVMYLAACFGYSRTHALRYSGEDER